MEQFRQLPGKFSRYAISENGRVFDTHEDREVFPTKGQRSLYLGVTLFAHGDSVSKTLPYTQITRNGFCRKFDGPKFR